MISLVHRNSKINNAGRQIDKCKCKSYPKDIKQGIVFKDLGIFIGMNYRKEQKLTIKVQFPEKDKVLIIGNVVKII